MKEINISDDDFYVSKVAWRRELSDIVNACELSMKDIPDKADNGSSIIEAFFGNYGSIKKQLQDDPDFLKGVKEKDQYVRCISTYFAANSVLNILNDINIQSNYANDSHKFMDMSIGQDDMPAGSDRELLYKLTSKLKLRADGSENKIMRYRIYTFFALYKNFAVSQLSKKGTDKSKALLKSIKISGPAGFIYKNVKKIIPQENSGNGKVPIYMDTQPLRPPEYEPSALARTDLVVGNNEMLQKLERWMLRHLYYDPAQKKNAQSGRYPENVLLYGQAGVGKNFTVDAVVNWIKQLAQKYNKEAEFMSFRNFGSIYKDGSRQILQKYRAYEHEQKAKIFYNFMDEFDAIIAKGADGQMSEEGRKFIGDFKASFGDGRGQGHIMTIALTNYSDEDSIEIGIRDRFKLLYVPGPQTPEDFAKLLYNETKMKLGVADKGVDWMALGTGMYKYSQQGVIVTGRDCATIVTTISDYIDNSKTLDQEIAGIALSYEKQKELIQRIIIPPTHETYVRAIKDHFKEKAKADSHRLYRKSEEAAA